MPTNLEARQLAQEQTAMTHSDDIEDKGSLSTESGIPVPFKPDDLTESVVRSVRRASPGSVHRKPTRPPGSALQPSLKSAATTHFDDTEAEDSSSTEPIIQIGH